MEEKTSRGRILWICVYGKKHYKYYLIDIEKIKKVKICRRVLWKRRPAVVDFYQRYSRVKRTFANRSWR